MRKRLSRYERRIAASFSASLLSLPDDSPELAPLMDRIEDLLKHFTKDMRLAWSLCLWALEFLAIFYYASFKPMSRMSPELRLRYVSAWHNTWWSVKRTIKRFLEAVVFMNYYSLPEVERRVGYTPRYSPARGGRDFPTSNLVRDIPAGDVNFDADVCVVGSGAGGAFIAMELAKAGRKVVIIEEGGFFDVNDFGYDAVTMTKKLYRAGGLTNTFGWPPILVPLGRCAGGTTVINSGTCFRASPKIFEWWADRFGLTGWSNDVMLSFYERAERILEVEPARNEVQGRSAEIFARGASKLGIEVKPLLRNAPGCCGSGVCCWGCPTNAKKSMQLNALPLALQSGAVLYTKCRAERIVFEGSKVSEVHARFIDPVARRRGGKLTVKAKVVVAACGSLHTPVLLDRSGIPDSSRQCGRNLTLHPASKVTALFDENIRGWYGIPQGCYADALVEEGIKLEGIFLPPAYTAPTILLMGEEHREAMMRYNNMATFGLMVSDTTRGRVVRGINGHSISLYTINREDLPKYQRGITLLTEAFFEAGAQKVFPGICTLPVVTKEQGAAAIAKLRLRNKDLDLQAFHPLGTCRMGADPREAVVDPNGRVYGIDNLFVADGSIFPTALGVNPQMTIMAAALKIAEGIHRDVL